MRLTIAGWIEALLFAGTVLMFISGDCGWVMVYAVAMALAASIVTCCVSRKHFTVACSGCEGLHQVGDRVTVRLTFTAEGFCVLPFITVNGRFLGQEFTARTSLIGRSGSVEIALRARECCLSRMDIDEIVLRDALGAVYLQSPVRPEAAEVAVLPRVVEYTGPEVPPSLLPSDDDEETAGSVLTGGMPGYEHRGYVPGDPLRRINYKLSAKKGTLLVRKDDNVPAESTDIVISPGSDGSCAEQAFALAGRLTSAGGTARVICGGSSFTAGFSSLPQLREWLAFRDLSASGEISGSRSAAVARTVVTIAPGAVTVS